MHDRAGVAGMILAGGKGERLGGVIKSELTIAGVRLLDRVSARLAGCEPLLVAHGHLPPEALRLDSRHRPVADLDSDYAGPLAGFAAAIAWLAAQPRHPALLVCAAVDAPLLPADYVGRLVAAIEGQDAVIASHAGQAYPTNSIWRVERFLDLPARIRAGTAPRSLKSLGAEVRAGSLAWPESDGGDPFANINTPQDRAEMELRAAVST